MLLLDLLLLLKLNFYMKKIIIISFLAFCFSSCLTIGGHRTIYSSRIKGVTRPDYVKGLDIFWDKYPEYRLDSICKQEIKTKHFTIYNAYLIDGGGDSISYFKNSKSLYPYTRQTEYTTIRTYYETVAR